MIFLGVFDLTCCGVSRPQEGAEVKWTRPQSQERIPWRRDVCRVVSHSALPGARGYRGVFSAGRVRPWVLKTSSWSDL